jgi:hypothetical protein
MRTELKASLLRNGHKSARTIFKEEVHIADWLRANASVYLTTKKQTLWPLVRERTIPTERPASVYLRKENVSVAISSTWLSHYAPSREIAGSRQEEVMEFYQFSYSFRSHYALMFTQPLSEINTRDRNKKLFWD